VDDGSKGTPRLTVGVDLGDRYSYLCFLDTLTGRPPPTLCVLLLRKCRFASQGIYT
jgi:hypothetical protein